MADAKAVVVPFDNKGLILKQDPAQLPQGTYQELTNMISVQEGCLAVRPGSQNLTKNATFIGVSGGPPNIYHSITKLNGIAAPARYVGWQDKILRSTSALPASGGHMTFTQVASGTGPGGNYTANRWTGIRYNSGTTGTPYEYFACPGPGQTSSFSTANGMVKDTGSLGALQQWGIFPPVYPAVANLDQVTILPATELIATPGEYRVNTVVAAGGVTGTGPGNIVIVPNSMAGIQPGALLNIGGQVVSVNDITTNTSGVPAFECYMPLTPSAGQAIYSHIITPVTAPTQFSTITIPGYPPTPLNAAFDGVISDGFSTDDVVHIAVYFSDTSQLLDFRLRVLVNGSTSDYYEKSILPSSIQSNISNTAGTATATEQLSAISPLIDAGALGASEIPYDPAQSIKPAELTPTSPVSNVNAVWTDIDIPKSQFANVGLAGNNPFDWSNVTGFSVVYVMASPLPSPPTVSLSSIYIRGGFGPNGAATGFTAALSPMDYAYTFRNIATGAESNPSILMVPGNAVEPIRQSVAVTIHGTADPQISQNAGDASMAMYRRGGLFSDGLFRHIGYITNPGATTAIFYDSVSDASLINANILYFDNDPPVTSTLPQPIDAQIAAISPAPPNSSSIATITLTLPSSITDLRQVLTIGSLGTIHTSGLQTSESVLNLEQVRIISIGAPSGGTQQVHAFIQLTHNVGELIEFDSVTGQPCNLGVAFQDSIFLAGDPNNPQTLYKSKGAMPESFPIEDLELQAPDQINVGSPSDPIMAVTQFAGEIICLNLSSIYTVYVFNGFMQAPQQTPAQRGLIGNWAWCLAANEIWYLSYDGIYSWAGGTSMKRSEPIDPLFQGVAIGPYQPIQLGTLTGKTYTGASVATMQFVNNEIRFVYVDIMGNYYSLRYNLIHQRWSIDESFDPISGLLDPITAQYLEPDTGNYLVAKAVNETATTAYLYLADTGTTDGWVTLVTDGEPIDFAATGAAYTYEQPALNKQYLDVVVELTNDGSTISTAGTPVTVACYYDYSATANSTDTFVVPASTNLGRHRALPLSFQDGFGKESYALTLRYSGAATAPLTLYSTTYHGLPLEEIQSGRAYDWDDLGYEWDKRLYQFKVTFDIPSGQSVTVVMDTITGIEGAQVVNQAVQSFVLIAPTGSFIGPTHLTASFPINDLTFCKKVRIRPQPAAVPYKIWKYAFDPIEKLPPDVVLFTQWDNYGSNYDKYCQQIDLDIDTGNVQASVTLEASGGGGTSGVVQTGPFMVTTTSENRHVNLTMPPQVIGKQFRLVLAQGLGGKAQLYNHQLITLPADKGPVYHSYDWDSLGWDFDKKLISITIQADTSSTSTTILMDTMTGIKGGTINLAAFTFVLDQPGRCIETFYFPDNTFAKQIRLYPQSDNVVLKEWKYEFSKLNYPPDLTLFTERSDLGWKCEKIARNLLLDINTSGVPASITLVADGVNQETFTVTTTDIDRSRVIATNSELIGRLWNLELTAGAGGTTQLFSWSLDYIREPCQVLYVDTYQTDFGYVGYKFLKQIWCWYAAPSSLTVNLFVADEQLFYTFSLPAQPTRDLARLYFPALQFSGPTPVLNKSKIYRMQISSAQGFKIYSGSRLEWQMCGADQHAAFQSFALTPEQQLPVSQIQAAP